MDLEQRVKALEEKFGKISNVPKKPREPRKPTEYNNFIKEHLKTNKSSGKSHKELFKDAAQAWGESKNKS
jgi:hypothetical protein